MSKPITVNTMVIAEEMKYNGIAVLNYRIEYPEFISDNYNKTARVLNRFYQGKALARQSNLRTSLYQMAVDQYLDDVKNGFPVRVFEALQTFQLTYNRACIISLFFDNYQYTGGAHGLTVRTSQTWNLKSRRMIKLRELYKCSGKYKSYIIRKIVRQAKENPDIYFENVQQLIERTFKANNFYCTPQGVVVYFQQYDIAPYASGIREFLLPYNKCIIDPARKCPK